MVLLISKRNPFRLPVTKACYYILSKENFLLRSYCTTYILSKSFFWKSKFETGTLKSSRFKFEKLGSSPNQLPSKNARVPNGIVQHTTSNIVWIMPEMSTLLDRDTEDRLLTWKCRRLESEQLSVSDLSHQRNLWVVLTVVIYDITTGRPVIWWRNRLHWDKYDWSICEKWGIITSVLCSGCRMHVSMCVYSIFTRTHFRFRFH